MAKSFNNNFNPDAKEIINAYLNKDMSFWKKEESLTRAKVLAAAMKVGAYKKFIKANKLRNSKDWSKIPWVDKKNYFRKFKFKDLGLISNEQESLVMTSTSGSTGKPTYFFRNHQLDWQYSVLAEHFLKNGKPGTTLLVNCFSMGIWIGGLMTYQAFRYAGLRGYPLSIITPGIGKKEIFSILEEIAPNFDNVILSGYPPFIKDIIDEAKIRKIKLNKFNLRLVFAAESFTENFRDYIAAEAGVKNVYTDTMNIYGSAELGAMAFETPGSIFIRRLALKNKDVFQNLFKRDKKVPTLAQYNPSFISFEENENQILITANNATPFVKYRIGDNGGVLSYKEVRDAFKQAGMDLEKEAKKAGIKLPQLPFVYVHERSDFSTTLYGLQIYPQTIKAALENPKLQKHLSGKFSMNTAYDSKGDQFLEVHLEFKPGKYRMTPALKKLAEKMVINNLMEHNHEYRELARMVSENRTKPRLNFWEYNHPTHFKSGVKQAWLKK